MAWVCSIFCNSFWAWSGWTALNTFALIGTLILVWRYTNSTQGLLNTSRAQLEESQEQTRISQQQTRMMQEGRQPFLVLLSDPDFPPGVSTPTRHPTEGPRKVVLRNDGGGVARDVRLVGAPAPMESRIPIVAVGGQSRVWHIDEHTRRRPLSDLLSPGDCITLSYQSLGGQEYVHTWEFDPGVKDDFKFVPAAPAERSD